MRRSRLTTVVATTVAAAVMATVGWVAVANAAGGPNLSLGKTASASSSNGPHGAGNLNDGNQGSYWESVRRLPAVGPGRPRRRHQHRPGRAEAAGRLGVAHPDAVRAGQHRRRVLHEPQRRPPVHAFNPASNNAVTINFPAASTRYVRVNITANTGWPAAQLVRAGGLRRRHGERQPRPGPPDPGERPRRRLRLRQRGRRQPGHLLGERQQLVPGVGAGRPRLVAGRQPRRAEAAGLRLGHPYPDAVACRAAPTARRSPTWPRRRRTPSTRPSPATRSTINFTQATHPLRADQHHRQQRLAGRAALRARGVRAGRRHRHDPAERAGHPVVHPVRHHDHPDLGRLHRQRGRQRPGRLQRLPQRHADRRPSAT